MSTEDTNTPTEDDEPDPGVGSGEGDSLGAPDGPFGMEPPSADQEANEAVSGGGMVQPSTEGEPKDTVDKDGD